MNRLKFLVVLALISTLGSIFGWKILRQDVFFSDTSPDGVYTVQLTVNSVDKFFPLASQQINFNLNKNGSALVVTKPLVAIDFYHPDFALQYPAHEWMSGSVLRFGYVSNQSTERTDSLVLLNRTNKTIRYLNVELFDLYLIFDIKPNATVAFDVPASKWNSWVTGEGEFEDGKPILRNGVNFNHEGKLGRPLQYCISVDEEGLSVSSPDVEGTSSGKPLIPMSAPC